MTIYEKKYAFDFFKRNIPKLDEKVSVQHMVTIALVLLIVIYPFPQTKKSGHIAQDDP